MDLETRICASGELVRGCVREYMGSTVRQLTLIPSGRNSRVYRVQTECGATLLAKHYSPPQPDRSDRLTTEVAALRFFGLHGLTRVPTLLCALPSERLVLLEWIEGSIVEPERSGEAAVDAAAAFFVRVNSLRRDPDAAALPLASDGGSQLSHHVHRLDRRLLRLRALARKPTREPQLRAFLLDEVVPFREELARHLEPVSNRRAHDEDSIQPPLSLVLSPSDFGLHNMIECSQDSFAFIDFEYFGWDTLIKAVTDFLLHPGSRLSVALQRRYLEQLATATPWATEIQHQLTWAWPLFALNWCLILLNEFIPDALVDRQFSGLDTSADALKLRQLDLAHEMLERARHTPGPLLEKL